MKRLTALTTSAALLLAALPLETLALQHPEKSASDARIQRVMFNEDEVYAVHAAVGTGTQIVLGQDEEILKVGGGFTAGWEVIWEEGGFRLWIKPKSVSVASQGQPARVISPTSADWSTNLLVTTTLREYAFDLVLHDQGVAIGKARQPSPVAYRIVFTYPAVAADADEGDRGDVVTSELSADPVIVNSAYEMQIGRNSQNIVPDQAFDDGRFTYIGFPVGSDLPSVYARAPDNTESIVPFHVDPKHPRRLVVQRLGAEFVLRLGGSVVEIFNVGTITPVVTSSGTVSPNVIREVSGGQQ